MKTRICDKLSNWDHILKKTKKEEELLCNKWFFDVQYNKMHCFFINSTEFDYFISYDNIYDFLSYFK
jgi:hypothetical protein